jgi:hypothetical protein
MLAGPASAPPAAPSAPATTAPTGTAGCVAAGGPGHLTEDSARYRIPVARRPPGRQDPLPMTSFHSNDRNRFQPTVEEHASERGSFERCCNEAAQLLEVGLGSK